MHVQLSNWDIYLYFGLSLHTLSCVRCEGSDETVHMIVRVVDARICFKYSDLINRYFSSFTPTSRSLCAFP